MLAPALRNYKLSSRSGTVCIQCCYLLFQELDQNNVSWKIYYSLTAGGCTDQDGDCGQGGHSNDYPVTTFADFSYSTKYLYENPQHAPCNPPTIGSQQAVGDASDAFCIDINHIAPIDHYMSDVANNKLPSYAFIETAYGHSDLTRISPHAMRRNRI